MSFSIYQRYLAPHRYSFEPKGNLSLDYEPLSYKEKLSKTGSAITKLPIDRYIREKYRETSQTTNMITVGNPLANVKYENDYMFGMEKIIPFVPKADNGDRYRTAAARITVGSSKAQLNLFTGDPGLDIGRYDNLQAHTSGPHAGKYTFTGGTANKYRAGALTLSHGPFRFGWDSEGIRHSFQNLLTHDRKKNNYTPNGLTPHFQHMGGSGSLFWYFGFGTGNTLW